MKRFLFFFLFVATQAHAVATVNFQTKSCHDFFANFKTYAGSLFPQTLTVEEWGDLILNCKSPACFNKLSTDFYVQFKPLLEGSHLLPELDASKNWNEFIAIASAMSQHGHWVEGYTPLVAVQSKLKQQLQDLLRDNNSFYPLDQLTENSYNVKTQLVDLLIMNAMNGVDTQKTFQFLNGLVEIYSDAYTTYMEVLKYRIKFRFNEARALEDSNISPIEFFNLETRNNFNHFNQAVSTQDSRSGRYKFENQFPWWAPKKLFRQRRWNKQIEAMQKQLQTRYSFQALKTLKELESAEVPGNIKAQSDLRYTGYWARRILEELNYNDSGGGGLRKKTKEVQPEPEFVFDNGLVPVYIPEK